jgi:hypothetical protein
LNNSDENTKDKTKDPALSDEELKTLYVGTGMTEAQVENAIKWGKSIGNLGSLEDEKDSDEDPKYIGEQNWGTAAGQYDIAITKNGILGMPFQFNENADPRNGGSVGRVYKSKIISNEPVVIFQVGRPKFMDGAPAKAKGAMEKIMAITDDVQRDGVLAALAGSGRVNSTRYYSFQDDMLKYYDYVNTMCRFVAIKMGLAGRTHEPTGKQYIDFDVRLLKNDSFWKASFGKSNYVAVYADASGTSVSESGSNSTGESALAGGLKKFGDMKREMDFLFGTDSSQQLNKLNQNNFNEAVSSITNGFGDPSSIFSRLSSTAQTIWSGGNLLFPEIWKDSSFGKSYTIDMKFRSPYGDPESVFLNVYVPFFHMFCMAMPRQNSKQGYIGPFIIKAYSKGWFNCDFGMIDKIDIKRGPGDNWTVNSFPTEIDVSISLKDLYPTIMMSAIKGFGAVLFNNNTGLMEYLNLMAGVELHGINWFQNWRAAAQMLVGSLYSIDDKIADYVEQTIYSTLKSVSVKLGSGGG